MSALIFVVGYWGIGEMSGRPYMNGSMQYVCNEIQNPQTTSERFAGRQTVVIHFGRVLEPGHAAWSASTPQGQNRHEQSRDGNISCGARGDSSRLAREARGWRRYPSLRHGRPTRIRAP